MKKVLMIASGLHRNGTETFMMNVFRNIDRSKIMFDFLIYEPDDNGYEQEAKELGASIYCHPPRKNYLAYRRYLKKFFKDHAGEYSAVHYNGNSFTDVYALQLARKHNIPVRIAHSHNTSTFGIHNLLLHRLHRNRIHKTATHYFACSESAKDWGFKNTKAYPTSRVICNGIELDKFSYNENFRQEIRHELNIGPDTFTVCHTGNFRSVKNHPFLISIFEEIRKRRPDSVLLLCGSGGNEEEVRQLIEEKGLTSCVRFVGIRKDVEKLLSAGDAYVFPSFYEGLPFALIEAQASGIPVFASDTISPEIKLTEKIELISLEKSPKEWAERILNHEYGKRTVNRNAKILSFDIIDTCRYLDSIYNP